ncbi:MAG: hypothetical protein JXA03_09675, partial [Bacteroidales bacterium]|nr:hypothetical protein [Bacteroidales bacterium]
MNIPIPITLVLIAFYCCSRGKGIMQRKPWRFMAFAPEGLDTGRKGKKQYEFNSSLIPACRLPGRQGCIRGNKFSPIPQERHGGMRQRLRQRQRAGEGSMFCGISG